MMQPPPVVPPSPLFAPRPPAPQVKWQDIALGVVNANVLAALLMSLVTQFASSPNGGYYGTAATVLIPLLMGFLAGATWRKLGLSVGQTALFSILTTVVGVIAAVFFIHEGAICLVMASPMLFTLVWGGTLLGILLCRPKGGNRPLAVSVVPMLLVFLVYDAAQPRTTDSRSVTTTMVVRASAASVYPHLVAFPRITAPPPTFILNQVGLPYPVETGADGAYIGSRRECRFSDNLVLGERITALEPGRLVAFDITDQPVYPEFTEHGRLLRGEMTVRDNGDGTCTLSGTSWYTIRVHPFWYFGAWADEIIHSVHRRVFTHIAELSET